MLGCHYGDDVRTPNLDRLGGQGILFERAYCADPVCTPARLAIYTGAYPHTNGAWPDGQAMGTNIANIGPRLTRAGIHCVHIGKWHLDGGSHGYGVAPDGWDPHWWFDNRNYIQGLPGSERTKLRNPAFIGEVEPSQCFCYQSTERAPRFLDESREEDFPLVVEYEEPHHPWLAPEPFGSMFDDVDLKLDADAYWEPDEAKPGLHRAWAANYRSAVSGTGSWLSSPSMPTALSTKGCGI